ncbi:NAD-glutamate dehydrogenase [Nocardioides jiangxiensis]|uniref:NAD-glutamate dehydrogenase n=1 Tax=Nocardioides jiangxiensis TaxID=3064524 RepID=A0ABT9B6L1_9ACTN|nr:NAD-glutamate dehydrogenase [Nocardioides sp. WY-20]MDO7868951.1 NAD-glutamate dehydrogenase [Nocardioides sp. WY-20]
MPRHDSTPDVLLQAYFRHIAPEDLADRLPDDLAGALASHRKLASLRASGTVVVRVHTPRAAVQGWEAHGHTVVEVVTEDMPFLVDSVLMALAREGHDVHLVVHPRFDVMRTAEGALLSVEPADERVPPGDGWTRESWMHVEVDRLPEGRDIAADFETSIRQVLDDVRSAVHDWQAMRAKVLAIADDLESSPPPLPAPELEQGTGLLRWLADDHFTFLGYREYDLLDDDSLQPVAGSGLGILRGRGEASAASFARLPPHVRAHAREQTLLVLAKANSRATVHRSAYLDYVGVKRFDAEGVVTGERRFLGLWSSAAYTESLRRIPLLSEKADAVLAAAGLDPLSHAGKALVEILEDYPRDELLTVPVEDLVKVAEAVLQARERRRLRLFVRPDTYRRYLTCLVYVPRDRYSTSVRERFAAILRDRLGASTVEYSARVGESPLAQVHFVVRPENAEAVPEVDVAALEHELVEAARSWSDDFVGAVTVEFGESEAARLVRAYRGAFPPAYVEEFSPRAAAVDVRRIEAIQGEAGVDVAMSERVDAPADEVRLSIYRVGEPLTLTAALPMLASLGVEVVDERPHELEGLARPTWIYEFGLRAPSPVGESDLAPLEELLRAILAGECEVDGFNALVLGAGLHWRQAAVLRAYARYLKQAGTPFSLESIEEALRENVALTRLVVGLFEARFDPDADAEGRSQKEERLREQIVSGLDDVVRLDHDRILRSYLALVSATLRTNHFMVGVDGRPRACLALKLDPGQVPDLPAPRPQFEIFVHSPRVEGVHLRFGAVARGGLRWSDRRDDYRTEVLGLVKAQMVKNTVIVPVGAKGGFYAKHLPDPADREAWLAEGIACYRTFIAGLLDLTDNMVSGEVVPPARVVRHDGDDAYLVVAADKGTATFSDIANEVAAGYGFWLGDAFASGGSAGYDHKAMGITARGAWVSVQRHFREMGVDCQNEEFTCVGIGDMSGDVFGNGLLSSRTTRLVAAFDHRDIFLDPDPDPSTSYDERARLFALPRSSWQDYDRKLISAGGGVWSRQAKQVPVSPEVAAVLGLDPATGSLPPNDLLRAILAAPVDLLWNGGIGTYVKGAAESHADVGDKANDAIRINGAELRVRCVGEGGNLGLTQLGRIEYAAAGGRINTDFIDNSAGVDTSDREVNLKILLDAAVDDGDLTGKQRNALLASMTDEVAALVLRDNYEQNLALANALATAPALLHVHESWLQALEQRRAVDRELEGLPAAAEVRRRQEQGEGLTAPELAVMLSWTKIVLARELLESDLPDDPFLRSDLYAYFPSQVRQEYRQRILRHPLRREIIVTQVVNDLVNGAGITFWHRLSEETSASAPDLARANFVAREIFASLALRERIAAEDNRLDASVQTTMRIEMRTLVERASRWLVTNRRSPLASEEIVDYFGEAVQRLMDYLPGLLGGREREGFEARRDDLLAHGVDEALATRVAVLQPAYVLLGVVETAEREQVDPLDVARVHFALGERLGLSSVVRRVQALPRRDRWEALARAAVRDDLHAVHAALTEQVLQSTPAEEPAPLRVALWEERDAGRVQRAAQTLEEICVDESADLARVAVGLRVVRGLVT